MYLTDLDHTEALDITPPAHKGKGKATVRWLIGEPEGAPNFEMRYFALSGDISTEWHNHQWEHQAFVVKGRGRYKGEEKEVELVPGCAVYVEPGEQHHFICDGDMFEFICIVPKGTRVCVIDNNK